MQYLHYQWWRKYCINAEELIVFICSICMKVQIIIFIFDFQINCSLLIWNNLIDLKIMLDRTRLNLKLCLKNKYLASINFDYYITPGINALHCPYAGTPDLFLSDSCLHLVLLTFLSGSRKNTRNSEMCLWQIQPVLNHLK